MFGVFVASTSGRPCGQKGKWLAVSRCCHRAWFRWVSVKIPRFRRFPDSGAVGALRQGSGLACQGRLRGLLGYWVVSILEYDWGLGSNPLI